MIGRFQVMVLLQYERFKKLGFSEEEAKSLAVFFATFYACLKNRYIGYSANTKNSKSKKSNKNFQISNIIDNNEETDIFGLKIKYKKEGNNRIFIFGNKEMDDKKFLNTALKFRTNEHFQNCLNEVKNYINQFPIEILQNHNRFFNKVYKPVRDKFRKDWSQRIWNN